MHAHARTYTHTHIQKVEETVRSLGHAAKHQVAFKLDPSFSDLDLPFAINLFYSMFTIAYTPRFPYQFKMTLIEYSRILKHNECSRPGRLGARHDSMLTSRSRLMPRTAETCRDLPRSTEYALFSTYTRMFDLIYRLRGVLLPHKHQIIKIIRYIGHFRYSGSRDQSVSGQIWTSPHLSVDYDIPTDEHLRLPVSYFD